MFLFSGATGQRLHTLNNPTPQERAWFGSALAEVGDIDGDGVPDLAVGADGQFVGGREAQGQVFLFSGATGQRLRTLDNPTPQEGARFGFALAKVGDMDGDGAPDLAVGAFEQAVGGRFAQGQVFLFSGATGQRLQPLNDPIPQELARFGWALAGVGDVDGDGVPDLAVGAPFQHVGSNLIRGRVFLFSGATGQRLQTLKAAEGLGFALAGVGDVDGDSVPDLAVAGAERAFVFSLDALP